MRKSNPEEFIEKAKRIHGDKYDYSKVNYVNNKTKVCIYCPIHKEVFWQTPGNHTSGAGCPKCANETRVIKSNTEEFIEKARKLHGDKYDYSEVDYINNRSHVKIWCKTHKEFFNQNASSHIQGHGCPKCAHDLVGKTLMKSHEDLIEEFRKVHGDSYDYSLVKYKNTHEKVKIICKEHGEFWQRPKSHLRGIGHPNELSKKKSLMRLSNTEEFIKKAKNIHGDEFDYSKVVYTGCYDEVLIHCKKHGDFWQKPSYHLSGSKHPCLSSKISKPEIEVQEFVKSLGIEIENNTRQIIKPKELDIYIPSLKKAIEFNGWYWHYDYKNPSCKPKGYHAMKSNLCRDKGIKLLHVREELWLRDKEKMKEVLIRFIKEGN